jgi:hypothetical protein
MAHRDLVVRSYRPGDEQELAPLYNDSFTGFAGPFRLSPETWRAQWQADWRSPSLESDPECLRVAERGGRLAGYAVADHSDAEHSVLQELCIAGGDEAGAVARVLIEDAEAISRGRGKLMMLSLLPHEDALAARAAEDLGYEFHRGRATFMTLITDLPRFLGQLAPELERRLAASAFTGWQGEIEMRSGDLEAELHLREGAVQVRRGGRPTVTTAHVQQATRPATSRRRPMVAVEIAPERLPLLLLGRSSVGEAYLWDELAVIARDRMEALRLLHVLFPPLPMALPRQQWW